MIYDSTVYDLTFVGTIGLLILLLQSDYLLTIQGYILYKKYYAEYYELESYELNPLWRKAVERRKKFNSKHITLTALIVILLIILIQLNKDIYMLVIGIAIFPYLMINLRHLQNILLFLHFKTRRDVEGHIKITLTYGIKQASITYLIYTLFFTFIFLVDPTWVFLGGAIGFGLFYIKYTMAYRRRIRKKEQVVKVW